MQPRRAALYLRVSTDRQETECQRPEVEQLARARGFEVVRVFEETMWEARAHLAPCAGGLLVGTSLRHYRDRRPLRPLA